MRVVRWIFFLLVVYILLDFVEWGFLRSEITVYTGICKEVVRSNHCGAHDHLARPVTYTVYPDQQTVVYGMDDMPLQRFAKCAVANRRNWTCKSEDEVEEVGFRNGDYFRLDRELASASRPLEEAEYYVPRWRYRLLQIFGK